MDVVGHAESLPCMGNETEASSDDQSIDEFLRRLSAEHQSAEMQEARIEITDFGIPLWATCELRLLGGAYRVTWSTRIEENIG